MLAIFPSMPGTLAISGENGSSIRDGMLMEDSGVDLQTLRTRMTGIGKRLDGAWADKLREHLHLDRSTKECAYWHAGYHQALEDVLSFMSQAQPTYDISGTSSLRLAAG
jgi:hypothetical protein